ncbi:MAG: hypothetical protein RRY22_04925 [Bacilli bacterium]
MEQLEQILRNPLYYVLIMVMLGIIQIIPEKIIKAKPITWIGKRIGLFINGCYIQEELYAVNMKIDINDFQARRNRVLSFDMLLRKSLNYHPSRYDYENIFDDIKKLSVYKKDLEIKYNIVTNGELKIAIKNIENRYKNETFNI